MKKYRKTLLLLIGFGIAVVLIKASQNLDLGWFDIPASIVGWAYLALVTFSTLRAEVKRCFR